MEKGLHCIGVMGASRDTGTDLYEYDESASKDLPFVVQMARI